MSTTAVPDKSPPLVYQREEYDCFRASVATLLGIPYEETPDVHHSAPHEEFWFSWHAWAIGHGLVIRGYHKWTPMHYPLWLAAVGEPLHSVVMRGNELYHDPSPEGTLRRQSVEPEDVKCAMVIRPIGESRPAEVWARPWQINRDWDRLIAVASATRADMRAALLDEGDMWLCENCGTIAGFGGT